jgi:hypothetical protein
VSGDLAAGSVFQRSEFTVLLTLHITYAFGRRPLRFSQLTQFGYNVVKVKCRIKIVTNIGYVLKVKRRLKTVNKQSE